MAIFSARGDETKSNAPSPAVLYENNFEQAELDKAPEDFLVLDGGFAVKSDGANKFLELPGAPLDSFSVLVGPSAESNVVITAKIRGVAKGRRFPTFGIGLNGAGGYRLQVSPAKKLLELFKGDEVIASAPFEEKLNGWMFLRLENRQTADDAWKISGKVWPEKSSEANAASVSFTEKTKPIAGRASLFASPFSETPIQFDDLKIISLPSQN